MALDSPHHHTSSVLGNALESKATEPLTGPRAPSFDLTRWGDTPVGAGLANANKEGRKCKSELRSKARHQAELGD